MLITNSLYNQNEIDKKPNLIIMDTWSKRTPTSDFQHQTKKRVIRMNANLRSLESTVRSEIMSLWRNFWMMVYLALEDSTELKGDLARSCAL